MRNLKGTICFVGVACFIASILLASCSWNRNAYYVDVNNDTIAYLLSKNGSSKTAQIEVYKNYLLERDSIHKCLYDYYKLNGYKTLVSAKSGKEDEALYKHLLNEDSSIEAFFDMLSEVETEKRYYPKDSLNLRELLSILQVKKGKIFNGNTNFHPADYYAMLNENDLIIYENDFKEDTLRLLDYTSTYAKEIYEELFETKYSHYGESYVLKTAENIRFLSGFANECIKKDENWEEAQLAMISLKRYQLLIFTGLKIVYKNILEKELEKYQLDNIKIGSSIGQRNNIESELSMTAEIFKNEQTCNKIFNKIEEKLYLLGIAKVIFKWGTTENESRIMRVSPEPLANDQIG